MDQLHQMRPPVIKTTKGREDAEIDRKAIRANYKKFQNSLRDKDIVNYLKRCYTTYQDSSEDITLPRDLRFSYFERATSFKTILDYIERQCK